MKVLIACKMEIYRFAIKTMVHELWKDAVVHYAEDFEELTQSVFTEDLDLLILEREMFAQGQLESFVSKAIKYSKVMIFSDHEDNEKSNKALVSLGIDAFLPMSCSKQQVINTLTLLAG